MCQVFLTDLVSSKYFVYVGLTKECIITFIVREQEIPTHIQWDCQLKIIFETKQYQYGTVTYCQLDSA
jgi:hypothetical protein